MKPAAWLLKSEPDAFSIDALIALPGRMTYWDGVRNYQARNNLVAMQKRDRAFFYHSNCPVTAIVGEMVVTETAKPDPSQFDSASDYFDPKSTPDKPRWFAPRLRFVVKYEHPLTRATLAETALRHSLLFTNSRLSVIPLYAADVRAIDQLLRKEKKK